MKKLLSTMQTGFIILYAVSCISAAFALLTEGLFGASMFALSVVLFYGLLSPLALINASLKRHGAGILTALAPCAIWLSLLAVPHVDGALQVFTGLICAFSAFILQPAAICASIFTLWTAAMGGKSSQRSINPTRCKHSLQSNDSKDIPAHS